MQTMDFMQDLPMTDLNLCVSLAFFYMQNSLAGFVFAKSVRE